VSRRVRERHRTVRRRAGVALVALGTIAVALALSASPVNADAPEQTGWWFELQTKTLPVPLPSPPVVPAGGLFVQQGPQGPTAYGALRYRALDAASAILTLAAAQGSTTSLGTPLEACPTSSAWQQPASEPGNWEDAPKYGSVCTPGRISSDGKFVAFAFDSSFFKGGTLDVAIVPIEGASPFAIAFDKPAGDSLAVEVARPPVTTPTTVLSAPSTGGSSTSAGSFPKASVTPAAPATPAAPVTTSDSRPSIANTALNIVGLGDPDRGERAAALGGASAIVIGWWLLSTQAVPMPKLLGGMNASGAAAPVDGGDDDGAKKAPSRVGGVGRFSRTRDHNALKLR
jgi:hypothetical protein